MSLSRRASLLSEESPASAGAAWIALKFVLEATSEVEAPLRSARLPRGIWRVFLVAGTLREDERNRRSMESSRAMMLSSSIRRDAAGEERDRW
eukprot:767471-Hanusia_phi.AAC.3